MKYRDNPALFEATYNLRRVMIILVYRDEVEKTSKKLYAKYAPLYNRVTAQQQTGRDWPWTEWAT